MAVLQLVTLGTFAVRVDGEPVSQYRSDKIRALLVYLAIESDRLHRREFLSSLLWPAMERAIGLRNLRNSLSRLRRTLGITAGDRLLLISRQTIGINRDEVDVDVLAFDRSVRDVTRHDHTAVSECEPCLAELNLALQRVKGEFLSGFNLADAPAFSDWLLLQRERWHQQHMSTLHTVTAAYIEQGAWEAVLRYGQQQLAVEPWRESAHRQLMQAYAGLGQIGAVRRQFESCRHTLRNELGLSPSAQTAELYERLVQSAAPPSVPSPLRSPHRALALPRQFTSFVGRSGELREINGRLDNSSCALLTLLGPGGAGKTRLAIELTRQRADGYLDGAIYVPLAQVSDVADLPAAIVDAIGELPTGEQGSRSQLLDYLRARQLLLVLDNFEHLLAGASLLLEILQQAPAVQLLVTSRSSLNLRAEWLYELGGLSVPATDRAQDVEAATAVHLFRERLSQMSGDGSRPAEESQAINRICRLVDGMPLAIELAASQSRLQTVTQVAQALEQSMDAVQTEMIDVPPRQRSMRAVFNYSWQTLNQQEQDVLIRLSIFPGGFALAAAAAIADASPGWLSALQDKSFLQQTAVDRVSMHEMLRQFAREKLTAVGLEEAGLQKHSQYYLDNLIQQEPHMVGREGRSVMSALQVDLANILQAWETACRLESIGVLQRAQTALTRFLSLRWLPRQGQRAFALAAAAVAPRLAAGNSGSETHLLFAQILNRHARFLLELGRIGAAAEKAHEALAVAQAGVFEQEEASALLEIGMILENRSDYVTALEMFDEAEAIAVRLARQTGINVWEIRNLQSAIYKQKCTIHWETGNFDPAISYVKQALALDRENGDVRGEANCFHLRGQIELYLGNYDQAIAAYEESMALSRLAGNIRLQHMLHNSLALAYAEKGDNEAAKSYFQAHIQIGMETGDLATQSEGLNNLGLVSARQGAYVEAESYYRQALDLARRRGDRREEGLLLGNLGVIAMFLGDFDQADQLFAESLRIRQAIKNRSGTKYAHFYVARLALYRGDAATAVAQSQKVLDLAGSSPGQNIDFLAQTLLGHAYWELNRPELARPLYEDSLAHCQRTGQVHLTMGPLSGLARIALRAGALEQAVSYCNQILEHALERDLEGIYEKFDVWLVCIEVLNAAEDNRAKSVLLDAYGRLQALAALIPDPEIRHQFLHTIASHRKIVRLAQQLDGKGA